MKVSEDQMNAIVDRIVQKMAGDVTPAAKLSVKATPAPSVPVSGRQEMLGCFDTIEEAILAAERAFHEFKRVSIAKRKRIIEAIRQISRAHIPELARRAIEETKMGRYEDKLKKNECAIDKTPGVEDIEPFAFTGDQGLTLLERAPFGVIGSITPCTNPTETIISNGIGMIAGGNSVVFNTHPTAKRVSVYTINLLNKAVLSEGGPANLFTTVITPTIESAQTMMKHPKVNLLVVTGGPAVVASAMKSGKRVIGAGPGNPPVVVDETADIDAAARHIIASSSTDNNIICVIEKEIIVVKTVADALKKALIRHGGVEVGAHQAKRLEQIILTPDKSGPAKDYIGKDVQVILRDIGMDVDASKRLAIVETGPDHPFAVHELLMPVVPLIRVNDINEAIELAYKLEGGCFHTSVIHSKNIDNMNKMHERMNTSIFVKNGPALAGLGLGGEGPASFTIASPTGEGVTTARHFTRTRRCVLSGHFGRA